MNRFPGKIVEMYSNTLFAGGAYKARRWWIDDRILIGGSILDQADYEHLYEDFGVRYVLNLEIEHTDEGKVPAEFLHEARVADDGQPKSAEWFRAGFDFVDKAMRDELTIYVHCQMGGSRSAIMAYAIMRRHGVSSETALGVLRQGTECQWGAHPFHPIYIASAEAAVNPETPKAAPQPVPSAPAPPPAHVLYTRFDQLTGIHFLAYSLLPHSWTRAWFARIALRQRKITTDPAPGTVMFSLPGGPLLEIIDLKGRTNLAPQDFRPPL